MISVTPVKNFDPLKFIREATEWQNGAFYPIDRLMGENLHLKVWRCDVTRFVFGYFPQQIYLSIAS